MNILNEKEYQKIDKFIKSKLLKLTENLISEVDKETWGEEPIDNSNMISVDDENNNEENMSAADFIMKAQGIEQDKVEPNKPEVLSEFNDLSNEEKKALLLQLAKDDNDLDAILRTYLEKKLKTTEDVTKTDVEYAMKNTQDVGSSNDSVISEDALDNTLKELMKDIKNGEGWADLDYVIQALYYDTQKDYRNQKDMIMDRINKLGYGRLIRK